MKPTGIPPRGTASTGNSSAFPSNSRSDADIQETVAQLVQKVPKGQHLQALLYTFNGPLKPSFSEFVKPYDAERIKHARPDYRFSNGIRTGLATKLKQSEMNSILPLLNHLANHPEQFDAVKNAIINNGIKLLKTRETDVQRAVREAVDQVPDGQHLLAFLWTWGGPNFDDDGNPLYAEFQKSYDDGIVEHDGPTDFSFANQVKFELINRLGNGKENFDILVEELKKGPNAEQYQLLRRAALDLASGILIENRQLPYTMVRVSGLPQDVRDLAMNRIVDMATNAVVDLICADQYPAHALLTTIVGLSHLDEGLVNEFLMVYHDELAKFSKAGLDVAKFENAVRFSLIDRLPESEDKQVIRAAYEVLGTLPADRRQALAEHETKKIVQHLQDIIVLQYISEHNDPGYEQFAAKSNANSSLSQDPDYIAERFHPDLNVGHATTTTTTSTTDTTITTGVADPTPGLDRF